MEDTVRLQGATLPELKEYREIATVLAGQVDSDFEVDTLEGTMKGKAGDYLCKGSKGEFWPIKREIFEETYVPVNQGPRCAVADCPNLPRIDPYKMRKVYRDPNNTLVYTDEIVETLLCTLHASQVKLPV